jgi:hypothetical protein
VLPASEYVTYYSGAATTTTRATRPCQLLSDQYAWGGEAYRDCTHHRGLAARRPPPQLPHHRGAGGCLLRTVR